MSIVIYSIIAHLNLCCIPPEYKSDRLHGKQWIEIEFKEGDEYTGRSVAQSIWVDHRSVGETISQVRKAPIEPAQASDIHPMHALIHHPGSVYKATISDFPKEKSLDLNILKTLYKIEQA